jgi:hypothetical protein
MPLQEKQVPSKNSHEKYWQLALLALVVLSILYAGYVGFRAPNRWSVQYYQFSWLEGFFRRGLLGTLLHPFGCDRFDYHVIKTLQFCVLGALLTFCLYAARTFKIGLFLSIYFISPAGAYLFHTVGYIEQLLGLMSAASIYALHKKHWRFAAALLTTTILTHEMALFITIPLAMAYLLISQQHSLKLWCAIFIAPAVYFAVLYFAFQQAPAEAIALHKQLASHCKNVIEHPHFLKMYSYGFFDRFKIYYDFNTFFMPIGILLFLALLLPFALYWHSRKWLASCLL